MAEGLEGPNSLTSISIPLPKIDQFAEILSAEKDWCTVGMFLGVSSVELAEIGDKYRSVSVVRCLIELYTYLERKGKLVTWESIISALRKMNNHSLANKVLIKYIRPHISQSSSASVKNSDECKLEVTVTDHIAINGEAVDDLGLQYCLLVERYTVLTSKVKRTFINRGVDAVDLQDLVKDVCGVPILLREEITTEQVFDRVKERLSILNFRVIVFLIENMLPNEKTLLKELESLKAAVDRFKCDARLLVMVDLIKDKQVSVGNQRTVQLKVKDFWENFSMKQFELAVFEIFDTLYDVISPLTITKGCICVTWSVPDCIDPKALLPKLPSEFLKIIGVILICIGDELIYNIECEEGRETIEAAMLQAIELKNTRAMELLLSLGCSILPTTPNGGVRSKKEHLGLTDPAMFPAAPLLHYHNGDKE